VQTGPLGTAGSQLLKPRVHSQHTSRRSPNADRGSVGRPPPLSVVGPGAMAPPRAKPPALCAQLALASWMPVSRWPDSDTDAIWPSPGRPQAAPGPARPQCVLRAASVPRAECLTRPGRPSSRLMVTPRLNRQCRGTFRVPGGPPSSWPSFQLLLGPPDRSESPYVL
jgi:hypothetical protein